MWFQLDGAPVQFAIQARQWLIIVTKTIVIKYNYSDKNYPGRQIGREKLIAWPTRSPNLTPLDFDLQSHIKYSDYINARINAAVATKKENHKDAYIKTIYKD